MVLRVLKLDAMPELNYKANVKEIFRPENDNEKKI